MFLLQWFFIFVHSLWAGDFFYPTDYEQGRKVFREHSENLKADLFPKGELGHFDIPTKLKKVKLTTDYIYIPQNSKKKTHILILTSGVHGAEAFTGSAIQNQFLQHIGQNPQIVDHMGILIVHAVNPYGFHMNRRVTENNVDLNRNFSFDNGIYKKQRPEYEKLNKFLNPENKLTYSLFSNFKFFMKSIFLLMKHGRHTLANAILGGQYSFSKGIYYGGTQPEPNTVNMGKLFQFKTNAYKKVLHIDLHTGYGERGTLHFFSTNDLPKKVIKTRETLFKGYTIDTGDKENFYKITGEFTTFTMNILKSKTVIPMTFEFGTSDSQTTMGAMFSLRSSIYENQVFQWGAVSKDSEKRAKDDFSELFNPTAIEWRTKVLKDAKNTLDVVLERFSKL